MRFLIKNNTIGMMDKMTDSVIIFIDDFIKKY